MVSDSEKSYLKGNLRRSLSTPSLCGGGGGTTTAELCGGITAGFAALCCCGPCSIVSLVVLAVYKVPRGLCRRTIRRMRRRRLAKKGICENGESENKLSKVGSSRFAVHPLESKDGDEDEIETEIEIDSMEEEEEAVIALEKEMWSRFYSGGFWRSLSLDETTSSSCETD